MTEIVEENISNLQKKGFPMLTEDEKKKIESEIKKIPLDKDAETYFTFLVSELNISPKFGQKRSIDPVNNEHGLYLQTAFAGSGSRREDKSMIRYVQSLSWLQNKDKVNLDHITQLAPYVLWHRIKWIEEIQSKFRDDSRNDPLDLYINKTLLSNGTNEMPGVKKRFAESRENYQRIMNALNNDNLKEARELAKKYAIDGKGHPVFIDLMKELE